MAEGYSAEACLDDLADSAEKLTSVFNVQSKSAGLLFECSEPLWVSIVAPYLYE